MTNNVRLDPEELTRIVWAKIKMKSSLTYRSEFIEIECLTLTYLMTHSKDYNYEKNTSLDDMNPISKIFIGNKMVREQTVC